MSMHVAASVLLSVLNFQASERLFVPLERDAQRVGALRIELLQANAPRLRLDLSERRSVELDFVALEDAWGGGAVWRANVAGDPLGSALISILDGVAIGSVRTGRELWSLEYAGAGLHRLRLVDEDAMPVCGGAIPPEDAGVHVEAELIPAWAATVNAPPTIDVLVAYTTAAKDGEGSTSAMQAKVNLAIAETNQAYANSQVVQRLRLVHQFEAVGYAEPADFSTALGNLRTNGDGLIDNVHTLRNQYGADMVAMLVDGTQYCGIGYLMSPVASGFEGLAFSVTARSCATGYYSFGHELGHNMGCHHDRDNATSAGAYPYSYGYRTPGSQWRTVMAYSPGTRIQYFSNPNVSFAGLPLGVAEPAGNSAENWKSLNNTAAVVAQFRCAVPVAYGTSKTMSNGAVTALSFSGSPSVAANNLHVRITNGLAGKSAIAFYSATQSSTPWNGGSLYVGGQKKRLTVTTFNGSGVADFPFPVTQQKPGDRLFFQGWFRDPSHADGTTVGLTHGLRIDFCP